MGAHDWGIPEKADFPADEDQVLAAVRGVASLEAIEPKTANPDWHSQLGIGRARKGRRRDRDDAARFRWQAAGRASGRQGRRRRRRHGPRRHLCAQVGREPELARARLSDGEAQTCRLAEQAIVTVGRERIQEVDVARPTGSSYVGRAPPKTCRNLRWRRSARGTQPGLRKRGRRTGGRDRRLRLRRCAAHRQFRFLACHRHARDQDVRRSGGHGAHRREGRRALGRGGRGGRRIRRRRPRPTAINGRANGWAFKLPDYKYNMFAATLDSMLKPLGRAEARRPGAATHPAITLFRLAG